MERFAYSQGPPRRSPVRKVALLPIQPVDRSVLGQLMKELRLRGIEARIEREILQPRGACDTDRRQLKADILLEHVARCGTRPVVGVTEADCYAGDLNFVLGIAQVGGGAAVVCLNRLRSGATEKTFLARAIKEIFHELGHACGLGHCAGARCVMNFSNSLADTDAKSEELCIDCMRRLRT
jgi:archaemetzincin